MTKKKWLAVGLTVLLLGCGLPAGKVVEREKMDQKGTEYRVCVQSDDDGERTCDGVSPEDAAKCAVGTHWPDCTNGKEK